jgi:hypothetical protein
VIPHCLVANRLALICFLSIFQCSTFAAYLELSYSKSLSGPIPSELGKLSSLGEIYMASSDRVGLCLYLDCDTSLLIANHLALILLTCFLSLFKCSTITEELWLDGNQLNGPIPSELGKLINLRKFHMASDKE